MGALAAKARKSATACRCLVATNPEEAVLAIIAVEGRSPGRYIGDKRLELALRLLGSLQASGLDIGASLLAKIAHIRSRASSFLQATCDNARGATAGSTNTVEP
jgi:hypothetical protein